MTVEEKIRLIENSTSFAEVPVEAMPVSHKENYYFVSYSHKDYKEVLGDILRLEELGVNIWYDNEMHIGENWREIAQMYISKFQCSGVIFYLTENSISSPACNKEVEYVLTHNKGFLSINKALEGCAVGSGHAMLKELKKRGLECSDELMENFERAFSDEVLYLSMDESAEQKARKINDIKREELLELGFEEDVFRHGSKRVSVLSCKDNTILNIDLSRKHEIEDVVDNIEIIGDCVFTNASKLQSVRLSPRLKKIGDSAFRNCVSLTDVDLSALDEVSIGDHAFRSCSSLGYVDLSRAAHIGSYAFCDCKSLTVGPVNGSISKNAFYGTPVKRIDYIANPAELGDMAFFGCRELEEFNVANRFRSALPYSGFFACESLRQAGPFITEGESELAVGAGCFSGCKSIESIRFVGSWKFGSAYSLLEGCSSLREIELNVSDTVIPEGFAKDCVKLERITEAPGFTEIGEEAFKGCCALKSLNLSEARELGSCAFQGSGIENAYLKNVRKISKEAFQEAKMLKTVYIGEDCEYIGSGAFNDCQQLITVKILSPNVVIDPENSIFSFTDVKCLYVRSRGVLDALKCEGMLGHLRYLYVGDGVDITGLDLSVFEETESDEAGFRKLVQESVFMPSESSDTDPTSDEINEPDPYREKLSIGPYGIMLKFDDPSYMVGNDYEIKHSRLQAPHTYFVEDAVAVDGRIDHLTVSLHTGKSFRLDGSLIVTIKPEYDPPRSALSIDSLHELDGKSCAIVGSGFMKYCTVTGISVYSKPKSHDIFCRPIPDDEGRYAIEAVFYTEDGRKKAISAFDIDTITVFDASFNVEKVYENKNKEI